MEHELKTWPIFYDDVECGAKTFEIRKNDRDFKVGDILKLKKYDPIVQEFTGDWIKVFITYTICLDGLPDFPNGFIGMGIDHL